MKREMKDHFFSMHLLDKLQCWTFYYILLFIINMYYTRGGTD